MITAGDCALFKMKLVQLYYRGGVSEEVLQAEQQRIEHERTTARSWIEEREP
jgi:hypothetical protein